MHVIAAKAVCFKEALMPEFKTYQQQVITNSRILAEELIRFGFDLVSGGTDNHLILLDISNHNLGGKDAEKALDNVGIFTNKNMIPFDTRSPFDPSGIRVGTAALTTRGLGINEMKEIGELMVKTLRNHNDSKVLSEIKSSVQQICDNFPLYPGFEMLS